MMRYIMSYGVALALVLIIAGWLASGTLVEGGKGPGNGEQAIIDIIEPNGNGPVRQLFVSIGLIEEPLSEAEIIAAATPESELETVDDGPELQSVRTAMFTAQMMPVDIDLRGQTKANASIAVRAETSGILKQLHVSKGQSVTSGDLLCSLDRGTREARVAQAEASLAQSEVALARAVADLETNTALRDKGLSPANTARQFEVGVTGAEATKRAAIASLDDAQKDLDDTEIRTEIGGVIQDPVANIGDMLSVGAVCATIVQLDPMLFVGKVAETKVSLVQTGLPATVTTVTGHTVDGQVRFVSASADSATRAFTVEIELDNSNGNLLDGVTASASIHVGAIPAQFIPQSVLTLETDGTLGVQIVVDGAASFKRIQILGDETDGVWVGGLPATAEIITLGQEYVRDGQMVAATLINEGSDT